MKHRIASLAAGLLFALSAQAQAPGAAAPATKPLVLKAAHLFDGRSGTLVSPGVVVIQGERIAAVGANATIPADAKVVDLGDATLLPGFIDAHTHIASDHNDNWAEGFYEGMLRFAVEQSFHAERNARATLRAGVTTVREVGAAGFVINGWWHGALPSASLNVLWLLIGAIASWRILKKRGSSTSAT